MKPGAALWQSRLSTHLKTVSRYSIYAAQSGFLVFLVGAFLLVSFYYGRALVQLPESFPYTAVLVVWLLPFVAVCPIRTLLRKPDLIFLLPMESRMGDYFRGAVLYSFVTQGVLTVGAALLCYPLYRHGFGENIPSVLWIIMFGLVLKMGNLLGAWLESSMVQSGVRNAFRTARWLVSAFLLGSLFAWSLVLALGLFAAALAGMFLWSMRIRKARVHWSYLLQKEQQHRTTMLLFFNWFFDVPELPNRVNSRSIWAKLSRLIPMHKSRTFEWLYTLTLLRSEMLGIVLRLTLLSFVLLLAVQSPSLQAGIYVCFQMVTGVQLTALHRYHRHSVWPSLYPLDSTLAVVSAAKVAFWAHLAQSVLLALPLLPNIGQAPWLLVLPFAGAVLAWTFRRRTKLR